MRSVLWVLATTVGLGAGGFALHFPGSYGGLAAWDVPASVFGAILGFITGVGVALVQWAALGLRRREGLNLLITMGIGVGMTHALEDGAPTSVNLYLLMALSGIVLAATYAWRFREREPVTLVVIGGAWVAGLVVALHVTAALGMPIGDGAMATSIHHAAEGLLVGLVWGVATALVGVPARLRGAKEGTARMEVHRV
jgi:hypothetical protein